MAKEQEDSAHGFNSACHHCVDIIWEYSDPIISAADIATDVMITVLFYRAGLMEFFWVSIVIFIIAQIAYSALFVIVYTDSGWSQKGRFALFLLVFPFAQLIPFFMWAQQCTMCECACFHACLSRLMEACGLQTHRNEHDFDENGNVDWLKHYIMTKIRSHGGFVVEASVEAVPQSILQMVAIVVYNGRPFASITELDAVTMDWICDVSIFISMSSVASKGLMMSYSMDFYTFWFNFFCFVSDVFNIFATVGWLFWFGSEATHNYHFWLFDQPVDIFSLIWFWKFAVLTGLWAISGILFYCHWIGDEENRASTYYRAEYWGKMRQSACIGFLGTLMFTPFMIVVEGLKLSFFPLFILRSLDGNHATNIKFFRPLFDWFNKSDNSHDDDMRICVASQVMAKKFIASRRNRQMRSIEQRRKYEQANIVSQWEFEEMSLPRLREVCGYNLKQLAQMYFHLVSLERDRQIRDGSASRWYQQVMIAFVFHHIYITVPFHVISGAYSLVYPLICVFLYFGDENDNDPRLQRIFTLIYGTVIILQLLLAYKVYRFKYLDVHFTSFFSYGWKKEWMKEILTAYKRYWQQMIDTPIRNNLIKGCEKYPPGIAEIVIEFLPKLHVIGDFEDDASLKMEKRKREMTFLRKNRRPLLLSRLGYGDDAARAGARGAPRLSLDEVVVHGQLLPPSSLRVPGTKSLTKKTLTFAQPPLQLLESATPAAGEAGSQPSIRPVAVTPPATGSTTTASLHPANAGTPQNTTATSPPELEPGASQEASTESKSSPRLLEESPTDRQSPPLPPSEKSSKSNAR